MAGSLFWGSLALEDDDPVLHTNSVYPYATILGIGNAGAIVEIKFVAMPGTSDDHSIRRQLVASHLTPSHKRPQAAERKPRSVMRASVSERVQPAICGMNQHYGNLVHTDRPHFAACKFADRKKLMSQDAVGPCKRGYVSSAF